MDSALARSQWLGVEFRHLAALAAIAEEGTFRAAADRLGYVQSSVSQQIAVLERALGTRLIERSRGSHPIALTHAGRVLLEHFEQILRQLAAAWADVQALDAGRAGVVRLGLTSRSRRASCRGPAAARARHRISVSVTDCVDDEACSALAGGRLDAAVVSGRCATDRSSVIA